MTSLWLNALIHDLVPVLARQYLEYRQQGDGEGVEIGRWRSIGKVKGASEQLHAQEGKDENEQEEQEEEWDDGAHRAEKRNDQISQRWPVFGDFENSQ